MLKKIVVFLSISFLVFLWTLYYFHIQEKKYQVYLKKVETIQTQLEKAKLEELKKLKIQEKKELTEKQEKEKLIEQMIANQVSDVDSIMELEKNDPKDILKIRYQKIYLSAMKKNNAYMAIKAIKEILKYTKQKDIWYSKLVDLYLQVGDFKSAQYYAQQLIKIAPTKENLRKYVYVLFQNTNFFSKEQVNKLKQVVWLLEQKWVITPDDLVFYNFLISLLSDWNVNQIKADLPLLLKDIHNPEYKNLLLNIQKDLNTYFSLKETPLYYFKSLVALDLLKFWYFGLAKNIAERVYIQDSDYVLPQQILAYAYFYMWNYNQAIKYLKSLKEKDSLNQDEYNFFLGISYYWLGEYEKSLLYLSQVSDKSSYYKDVLRYSLLDYIHIDDKANILNTLKKLSNYKLNYVDYYNIFKYLLTKCTDCYKTQIKLFIKLLKKCYSDVDNQHQYVCWYGKWNLFLKYWKINLAVPYFKLLSKYFQDTYIFDTLAKYYEKKWNYKLAKIYYLKELLYTAWTDKRQALKRKIKDLFLKSIDNESSLSWNKK